jgi:hypothetical protein
MLGWLIAGAALAADSSATDTTCIPYAPVTPSCDRFLVSEWRKAAEIRSFFPSGSAESLSVPTTLYLMHDGRNLWVASDCEDPGFPNSGQAFTREPCEDLTLDESVQVVLGLGGGPDETLDFGGYAGAQDAKLGTVAHFYEFTVNACGSISRTYNQTPLRVPGFHAEATGFPGRGWQAVVRIPLASIGVAGDITGRVLHFNAFRFYRGVRYGLHLPRFGGYAGMPFVPAAFMARDKAAERTIQSHHPPVAQDTPTAPKAKIEFEFYPLARQLIATFPESDTGAEIRLCVTGGLSQTSPFTPGAPASARLTLPPDRVGTPVTATAQLLDEEGNVLMKEEKTFDFPAAPDWMGTDAGKDYTSTRVPRPWTPPVVERTTVKLAHAEFMFDGQAVPTAVTVRGRPVLSAPIRIVAEADGRVLSAGPVARTVPEPTRVLLESAAGEPVQLRTVVDFDGFMVVKCRFPGLDARRLGRLELHVPLAPDVPKYVNRGHLQDTAELQGHGYLGPAGAVWAGSANSGIFFSHDTPCFFADSDGEVRVIVPGATPQGTHSRLAGAKRRSWSSRPLAPFPLNKPTSPTATPELVICFVDAPGQVPSADYVFQFFLLPTPSRKTMPPPMFDRYACWFEEWSDYQGYPDLKKMPEVKRRADAAHAQGKKFHLYFHMQLAENSPGFAEFRNDLLAPPRRSWYKRRYDSKFPPHGAAGHTHCKDVPCWVCCLRGPCGDLLLEGMRRLNREGGVDGVYLDGPSHPFDCANPSHGGCGLHGAAVWDDDATCGRILGQRQFVKRMRGIFEETGSEFPIWSHTGGGFDLSTLSLCDFFYEGEQLSRYRDGYRLPLGKFLVGYSGIPFGFRGVFRAQIYGYGGLGTQALPYSLVHGTEAGMVRAPLQDKVFALGARDPKARFHPYWASQPHVSAIGDGLPFSYWLTPDHATLVVANAGYNGEQRMSFDLSGLFPDRPISVTRISSDEPVSTSENRLEVVVPEDSVRAYLITPTATPAVSQPQETTEARSSSIAFAPIRAFRREDWTTRDSVAGNTPEKEAETWPLRLFSRPRARAAIAALQPGLPGECTVKLRIRPSNRLRIQVDRVALSCGGGAGWRCSGLNELDPDGKLHARAIPATPGSSAVLELGFRNGRLNARWDGVPLLTDGLPEKPEDAHRLELSTWAGDTLDIGVIEITGDPIPEWPRRHPVDRVP